MSADDFDQDFDAFERKVLDNIDRYGCHINHVFDPAGEEADFSYSVGFPHTVGQGEVIVFGLTKAIMGSMINETLRQCRDGGLQLVDWIRISDLIEGCDVIARAVPDCRIEREYFNSAMWHHVGRYGKPLTTAFQLVWPSATTGLFPWDAGCHDDVKNFQPPLYEKSIH